MNFVTGFRDFRHMAPVVDGRMKLRPGDAPKPAKAVKRGKRKEVVEEERNCLRKLLSDGHKGIKLIATLSGISRDRLRREAESGDLIEYGPPSKFKNGVTIKLRGTN